MTGEKSTVAGGLERVEDGSVPDGDTGFTEGSTTVIGRSRRAGEAQSAAGCDDDR